MGQAKQRRKLGQVLDPHEELEWDYTSFIGESGHVDYSRIPSSGDDDPEGYAAWVAIVLALVHIDTGGPDTGRSVTGIAVASRDQVRSLALFYVKDCYRQWEQNRGVKQCA